jgi:hypothetical protein
MFRKVRPHLSFANVVAVMAMFIALGGFSYAATKIGSKQIANNSIRSKDIRTGAVSTSDIKTNTIGTFDITDGAITTADIADGAIGAGKLADNAVGSGKIEDGAVNNADLARSVAVAKGFATVAATNVNGPAVVLNHGGQQTSPEANGVSAVRVGTGIYDVTFLPNPNFTDVDSVDDLTWQVTGRDGFSTGSVFSAASTATEDQITLRIFMRRPDDGTTRDASFSVQFYTRT